MLKFKITRERIEQAATIMEYIGGLSGNLGSMMLLLPKLAVDADGNYIAEIVTDEDGDIVEVKGMAEAVQRVQSVVTPARLEKLKPQIMEALKEIVNPMKEKGSKKPFSSPEQKPPQDG